MQRPMRGQTVCKMHGGKSRGAESNGERRLTEAQAQALVRRLLDDPDAPPVTNPGLELQAILGRIKNAVDRLGEDTNELGQLDYSDANDVRRAHVVFEAWQQLIVEYRKALTDTIKLGIDAWAALGDRIDQAQAHAVVAAHGASLEAFAAAVERGVSVVEGREEAQRVFMDRLRELVPAEVGR